MVNDTRRKIADILIQSQAPLSGIDIGNILGISKVAVWKHVHTLIKQGYDILTTSDGYQLVACPDIPDEIAIHCPGVRVSHYNTVHSTMETARTLDLKDNDYVLITADTQTDGKARRGKKWPSPSGGIYLTIATKPIYTVHRISSYALIAAYSVIHALEESNSRSYHYRWPGDIYLNNDKAAGILLEIHGEIEQPERCLVGIGIYPPYTHHDGKDSPDASESSFLKTEIVNRLLNCFVELDTANNNEGPARAASELMNRSPSIIGEKIFITGKQIPGMIKSLHPDGSLLVQTEQSTEILYPGDVYTW